MISSATIANSLWFSSNLLGWASFRRACQTPAETQLALLRQYLSQNCDSAYGKAHRFAVITSYEQFAKQVPIVDYDALEPWINRITRGEPNVLTRDRVSHL